MTAKRILGRVASTVVRTLWTGDPTTKLLVLIALGIAAIGH